MAKVVVVGGGFAGAHVAKALDAEAEVTLVDSKEYFEIKWALPRALVEPGVTEKIIIPHGSYLKKATVVVGDAANATDKEVTMADGTVLPYDYLVIATGSKAQGPVTVAEKVTALLEESKKLEAAKEVLIVGGGPVGVELAGEVVTQWPDKKVILLHSGPRLLEFAGEKMAAKALKWLEGKGVTVLTNHRLDVTPEQNGTRGTYMVKAGEEEREINTDYLAVAVGGRRPDVEWLQARFESVLDKTFIKVDASLRVEGHSNVFAAGDITDLKAPKQGFLAMMHAKVIAANIRALIKAGEKRDSVALKKYKSPGNIVFLSLGKKAGIAQLPIGTFMGFLPTNMKSKNLMVPQIRKDLGLTEPAKAKAVKKPAEKVAEVEEKVPEAAGEEKPVEKKGEEKDAEGSAGETPAGERRPEEQSGEAPSGVPAAMMSAEVEPIVEKSAEVVVEEVKA